MNWGRHGRHTIESAKARFMSKTRREESGCLVWVGAKNGSGRYGACSVMGRPMLAHRAAYELFVAPIGKMVVCHKCDNGFCVEPSHLFLGSQRDNVADMEQKRRSKHPKGMDHGRAVITEEMAAQIVQMRGAGMSMPRIGAAFGVSKTTISRVLSGDHWAHQQKSAAAS